MLKAKSNNDYRKVYEYFSCSYRVTSVQARRNLIRFLQMQKEKNVDSFTLLSKRTGITDKQTVVRIVREILNVPATRW